MLLDDHLEATAGRDLPPAAGAGVRDDALFGLLRSVAALGYRFTTVTPATHLRVLARRHAYASSLAAIFGWNLPFARASLAPALFDAMHHAGVLQPEGALFRSTVRIASLGDDLFLHSAFPTVAQDAVFFGPDTYRFARLVRQVLESGRMRPHGDQPLRILDVGCGSGAGAIAAVRALAAGTPAAIFMNDINPAALALTAVNARAAGIPVVLAPGDALSAVSGAFDLIISNPPYIDDAAGRAYRHGGERLGRALSVRIAAEAVRRLAPGGSLVLYTGVAMVDQRDPFLAEIDGLMEAAGCDWSYDEIDPDVFGEELDRPAYGQAHRIAAVGLVATRRCES